MDGVVKFPLVLPIESELPDGIPSLYRHEDGSNVNIIRQSELEQSNTISNKQLRTGFGHPEPKSSKSKEKLVIDMTDDEVLIKDEARTTTPVFIVEEHHEVAPYWFQEAIEGGIPKHGNILIHIDGHSDFVEPPFPANASIFRFPTKRSDIKNLMTSNDAFIMSSAYSGFFSRIIFIYPSWDEERKKTNGEYDRTLVSFGYVHGKTHKDENSICACYQYFVPLEVPFCFVLQDVDTGEEKKEIKPNSCELKHTIISEILTDKYATKLVKSTDWITSEDNIVFDIDEDYYGCEAAILQILKAKIPEEILDEDLEKSVENLFCAGTAKEEMAFDKIHYDLLKEIATQKLSKTQRNLVSKTVDIINQRNLTQHLCVESDFSNHLDYYIQDLRRLNKNQLKAIAETGICLKSSPRQMYYDHMEGMQYCIGYNRPNDSLVLFFTPSLEQIKARTQQLLTIFKNLPNPRLVTICRSARDGYVPRKYASKIESDILESLMKVFPKITSESLHYDSNLLGGKSSWYGRHGNETW
ncbi:hypothetical protein LOTGIDRAFT_153216 [Lottia gigantea]|uniref:Uncharacterized protein n=1 Tax=Lottia gigantea TaxID=225164 RepID=V4AF21_LOTGI|nr:hypothetical protein LOTGIDRAFT_153216 [Lottia gigantea]ESO93755.1 hypothetical protein LOTGIDRAFT_153216 [Lottia gigantea]